MGSHHHGHHHHHHSGVDHQHHHGGKSTIANLWFALGLNLGFTVIELIGGVLTGSVAIIADALHDFGDALSLALAIAMEKLSQRGSTREYSYGYRRMSLLSATITSLILICGTALLIKESIPRLFDPGEPHGLGMMGLAVFGIIAHAIPAWRLWKGETLNEKTVSWHLIEDVIGWVLVLVGGAVIAIWDFRIIDPILSIVFSGFIFVGVFRNLRQVIRVFLQAVPDSLDVEAVAAETMKVKGVVNIHDIHAWSLDGANHVMSMHVVVDGAPSHLDIAELKADIRARLTAFGKFHTTLEIEHRDEHCHDRECTPIGQR
jgi:cobalt-zinc-cadmium efflux system protein